jgi:hypothetical protein
MMFFPVFVFAEFRYVLQPFHFEFREFGGRGISACSFTADKTFPFVTRVFFAADDALLCQLHTFGGSYGRHQLRHDSVGNELPDKSVGYGIVCRVRTAGVSVPAYMPSHAPEWRTVDSENRSLAGLTSPMGRGCAVNFFTLHFYCFFFAFFFAQRARAAFLALALRSFGESFLAVAWPPMRAISVMVMGLLLRSFDSFFGVTPGTLI